MADNIIVAVRVRPFNQREKDLGCKCVVQMDSNSTYLDCGTEGRKTFNFDFSYWSHNADDHHFATQETVYNDIGKGVLANCWEGYNSTLFAYGQTGSGKSFSMIGVDNGKTLPGVIPRVCEEIFVTLRENPPPDTKCVVQVSMLEIYNEKLRDLLAPTDSSPPGGLKMKQSKAVGFYVDGLSKTVVDDEEHVMRLMNLGATSRTIRATDMNAVSSRAHTLFIVSVEQARSVKTAAKSGVVKKTSMINLVDLAGSERAQKTGNTGDALKEGSNINLSLLYLGQVISMLAAPKHGQVVPFRQSKLTSLLKESLGGNSKTAMIAAISPAEDNFEETLGTLQFATRAKSCKTHAKVNLDEGSKLLNDLRLENEKLKEEMERLAKGGGGQSANQRIKMAFKANAKAVRQMFAAIDQDNSGEVSYEEFSEFLTEKKTASKLGEFSEILSIMMMTENPFAGIDKDGTGTITWEEFEGWIDEKADEEVDPGAEVERLRALLDDRATLMGNMEMSSDELAEQSKKHEAEVRMKVEAEMAKQISLLKLEVLTLRKQYGVKGDILGAFEKNRDKIESLFRSLDTDGSGQVSYDEFMEFSSRSQELGEFASVMEKLMTFDNPFEELDIDGDGQISWEEFLIWVQTQTGPSSKLGKSNEELQRLIDERDRELKIAQREAEKWKASSDLLESRVQGLVKMVNEMEEKMQRLDAAHRKEVAIWEQQAKMFMRGKESR